MRPETLTRRVGAGLSASNRAADAAGEAAREARAALDGASVDLAFLFLSAEHFSGAEEALTAVERELEPGHLLGCVAEGIVARDRELETGPAAAVWAASLPEAEIETFHSVAFGTDDGVAVSGIPMLEGADLVAFLVDTDQAAHQVVAAPVLRAVLVDHEAGEDPELVVPQLLRIAAAQDEIDMAAGLYADDDDEDDQAAE